MFYSKKKPKSLGNKKIQNKIDRKTFSVKVLSPLTDLHPRTCLRGTGQEIEINKFLHKSHKTVYICVESA